MDVFIMLTQVNIAVISVVKSKHILIEVVRWKGKER